MCRTSSKKRIPRFLDVLKVQNFLFALPWLLDENWELHRLTKLSTTNLRIGALNFNLLMSLNRKGQCLLKNLGLIAISVIKQRKYQQFSPRTKHKLKVLNTQILLIKSHSVLRDMNKHTLSNKLNQVSEITLAVPRFEHDQIRIVNLI